MIHLHTNSLHCPFPELLHNLPHLETSKHDLFVKILNKKSSQRTCPSHNLQFIVKSELGTSYSLLFSPFLLLHQYLPQQAGRTFGWLFMWKASGIRANHLSLQGFMQLSRLQAQKMFMLLH